MICLIDGAIQYQATIRYFKVGVCNIILEQNIVSIYVLGIVIRAYQIYHRGGSVNREIIAHICCTCITKAVVCKDPYLVPVSLAQSACIPRTVIRLYRVITDQIPGSSGIYTVVE